MHCFLVSVQRFMIIVASAMILITSERHLCLLYQLASEMIEHLSESFWVDRLVCIIGKLGDLEASKKFFCLYKYCVENAIIDAGTYLNKIFRTYIFDTSYKIVFRMIRCLINNLK